ncbi:MAG: beta-N-acetylglucosaminidase domain-containing protein, partial [Lentisphaeria bacterium]
AVQTLSQLLKNGKLQPCEINDYPDVPFRGTVEGFYGAPWKHQARLSQIEFYGKYKLNAYIYGPKDDPFHGFSNRWREAYPADKAEQIKELAKVACANKVNFIWAVHPGADVHWVDRDGDGVIDDFVNCLKKFEMMYALGVRSFAVFFDDIGGEGAKPERQAEMLNYLNRNFVKKKKDVTPLVMCPTQYNKAWSGGDYLDILGSQMDKDIDIMWTGNSVCTDITSESTNWINNRIKRNVYIWWNWPVTDYCRSQLLLGRTYGLDSQNKGKLSGFTSNPMDKPEASKIALFGVADYTWNMQKFNSDKSWKDGIKSLYPKFHKDMQVFANHNSDQGPSYHNYRREESAEFAPVIEIANKEFAANAKYSNATATKLISEFKAMQKSGNNLIKEVPKYNKELYFEIEYWIKALVSTGNMGVHLVNLVQTPTENLPAKVASVNSILGEYQELENIYNLQKNRAEDGTTPNDRRWSKGAHTASKIVAPFIKNTFQNAWNNIQDNSTSKKYTN